MTVRREQRVRARDGAIVVRHDAQRRELRRLLGDPEMLKSRPMTMMPLAAEASAALRASMRLGRPGIEEELRTIVRTDTAVLREERLHLGHVRHLAHGACATLLHPAEQCPEVGAPGDDAGARFELVRCYHRRTPSALHE